VGVRIPRSFKMKIDARMKRIGEKCPPFAKIAKGRPPRVLS
jgi:hypothetical protein